jgi:hypothetical protein
LFAADQRFSPGEHRETPCLRRPPDYIACTGLKPRSACSVLWESSSD